MIYVHEWSIFHIYIDVDLRVAMENGGLFVKDLSMNMCVDSTIGNVDLSITSGHLTIKYGWVKPVPNWISIWNS